MRVDWPNFFQPLQCSCTISHSASFRTEYKHFCSESCMGNGTVALCDFWDWSIKWVDSKIQLLACTTGLSPDVILHRHLFETNIMMHLYRRVLTCKLCSKEPPRQCYDVCYLNLLSSLAYLIDISILMMRCEICFYVSIELLTNTLFH